MGPDQSQFWGWNWGRTSGVTSGNPDDLPPLPVVSLRAILSGSGLESQGLVWVEQASLWRHWLAVFQVRMALLGLTGPLSSLLIPLQISAKGGHTKQKVIQMEGSEGDRRDFLSSHQRPSSSPVPLNHLPARGHAISSLWPCLPSKSSWVFNGDYISASFNYCLLVCVLFHTLEQSV